MPVKEEVQSDEVRRLSNQHSRRRLRNFRI